MDQSVADAVTQEAHGFPSVLTSFVGRTDDLAAVSGLLGGHRLVTVTGPGGVGKTRLAAEVARRAAGRFADGVWLAKLAPVADPALVPAVVAAALGVPELPGVPVVDALLRVLGRQQLLLVLDNCEHVIGTVAELCATLLATADDARILATSREPLRVAGEARYRLSPLPLPPPSGEPVASPGEAVALFADRARLADPHFALTGDTAPTVARLVRRLDGLPLAIELAAARVEALGVAQLADRLEDRLVLLADGDRPEDRLVLLADGDRLAADRQRTLAATLDWSYRLLTGPEQRVLRQLSAFPGPFTLEAAEAVAGLRAGPVVLHLVDCSLLAPPQAGLDGRYRYAMLETLRDYGARLAAEAGEQAAAVGSLARYAVSVAEEAAAGMRTSAGELAAVRLLDAEDATMRQALAWAKDHDPATALRLADALGWWWVLRGRLAGQYSLLAELAAQAKVGTGEWCAAQSFLGQASLYSANPGAALGHFTLVRDALVGQPPSRALADCLAGRSVTLLNLGRAAEVAGEGRRGLDLSRELGYPAGEALALAALSMAACDLGDLGGAVQLARQFGQVTAGIPGVIARTCDTFLVEVLTTAGEVTEASRICAEALAQCREVGDLQNLTALLARMTTLDLLAGRPGDAAVHLREELQIALRAGPVPAAQRPGLQRAPVRGYAALDRGRHGVGRVRRGAWA